MAEIFQENPTGNMKLFVKPIFAGFSGGTYLTVETSYNKVLGPGTCYIRNLYQQYNRKVRKEVNFIGNREKDLLY